MIREYCDRTKLDDALLKSYITQDVIEEASMYIESLALSMGVMPGEIVDPTPYMISRLCVLYIYVTISQKRALFSKGKIGSSHQQVPEDDSFALKYKMYYRLWQDLLKQITPDTFKNGKPAEKRKFPYTMPLLRG